MRRLPDLLWIATIAIVLAAALALDRRTRPDQASSPPARPADATPAAFAIRDVRVFDGERVIERASVIVRAGRIEAVGADLPMPEGLTVLDGSGRTLLPGLIDAHAHSFGSARRQALAFGVTVETDLHGDAARLPQLARERAALAPTDQADLWAAGFAVTVPGGHGTQYGMAVPTVGPDTDVAAFVGARIDEGADFVKLIVEDLSVYSETTRWPTLTPQQIATAIGAAHARDRQVFAHVSRRADALHAVRSGVDGLAHVFVDEPVDEALLAAAAAAKPFVVPTLSVTAAGAGAGDGASLLTDARVRDRLDAEQVASLGARFPATARSAVHRRLALDNVRRLHAAGVTILAGTDAGNPGTAHGASLHGELELLTHAGLSPREALAAATAWPAGRLGLADRGRIAPGLRADLVLVDGDPTREITATRAIVAIWKNGHAVERTVPAGDAASTRGADGSGLDRIGAFDETVDSQPGSGWHGTTDQMIGGRSTAAHRRIEPGVAGSAGALAIEGEIVAGAAFPWAGVVFLPGAEPMAPVDLSTRRELVFQTRGDGREYQVMLLSGPSVQGMPAMRAFVAGPQWSTVRLPLAEFAGADLARVRGIGFAAGAPLGPYALMIDEVELK
ncbi:MAG TPA: CIA30 family protein [Dokdonella sp.]|uniref:CIA30 family protein n=1 Tax=Dokdonella sp. TaxID=2291710 RepID=UPI002B9C63DD|nr:CIA30 family protein [Dokdonella sp.]HUD42931.1 CIA30 family protein [Dokdonella sp.]